MAERPEDLNLPTSVITRIVKEALPEGVNVSKDARAAFSKAASVFVLFATSCANNYAMKAKRKTLTAQDVINALGDMEFERFQEPLQECLDTYKREQKDKKTAAEKRKVERDQNSPQNDSENTAAGTTEENDEDVDETDDVNQDDSTEAMGEDGGDPKTAETDNSSDG